VTEPPVQNVVEPPAVIVAVGAKGAVNVPISLVDEHPVAFVNVILYVPPPKLEIVAGKVETGELLLAAPVHDKVPVPDPVTSIDPLFVAQDGGCVSVPAAIAGAGLTDTTIGALASD
jgi:hypothetical protein